MRTLSTLGLVLAWGCASGGGLERRSTGDAAIDVGHAVDTGSTLDSGPSPSPCAMGDTQLCTTPCASRGIASCDPSGVFGPCVPPAEDCNGMDDDCDGMTDEEIAERACSSACGGGRESCVSAHWMGCTASMPGTETCNGMDDDCDSRIDEMITRPCTTACGSGTETCMAGTFVGCTAPSPRTETCNGMDDDCDGMTDEMLTRACMNACGTGGTETCTSGAYAGCTAPAPPAETCNSADDDCDGHVDESLQVAIYDGIVTGQVTAFQAACSGPGGGLDVCLTAAKRWCVNRGCAVGGAGLLEGAGGVVRVACYGDHAMTLQPTFAQVGSDLGVAFDESMSNQRVAIAYSNRWCTHQGFAAGVGPVEHAAGVIVIQCLAADQASVERAMTLELQLHSCDPTVYPDVFDCNIAADQVCREHGFRAGWGPVEWNDMDSYLVCFH